MNYKLLKSLVSFSTFALVILGLNSSCECTQIQEVKLVSETLVTEEGLYFTGERSVGEYTGGNEGEGYRFGKRITPHGDCIDVINGYVFITWYKGGMDKRNLMLSRRKVEENTWQTIEFPYPHVGFRGNPEIGDSHNRAAIRICPIDQTVHVVFDLHAYRKEMLPNRYFSYIVSKPNVAFGDSWNMDNFEPLRTHLREDENYERLTYPEFNRFDDGRIMVDFRFGGSGNGNDLFSIYDGKEWSKMFQYNNGNQPDKKNYNFYGSFKFMHNKLYQGGAIRYGNRGDRFKYALNNGFYLACANAPFGITEWNDMNGKALTIPIQNPDVIKLFEPCDIAPDTKNFMYSMCWTVSESGDIHVLANVANQDVHFYQKADEKEFTHSLECPPAEGDVFAVGSNILVVSLVNGYPVVKSTPAGENSWTTLYETKKGDRYRHCNVVMEGNMIFLYAMKKGEDGSDKQPITLLTFSVIE